MIETKNKDNLPTYFQLGKNSVEYGEQRYIADPNNKGLVGNPKPGKRMGIPVQANILSKGDSGDRVNLSNNEFRNGSKSPLKQLASRLMKEESRFKDMYTPSKDDIRERKSSMQNQE